MSSSARWSYTAKATVWPLVARAPRTGSLTFGAPVVIGCDYSAKAERVTMPSGVEFVARMSIFTERADIKPGDRIMLGASTAADPISAGADEVRAVDRFADTFQRQADDYAVRV